MVGYTGPNTSSTDVAVVRYASTGALDATFGTGGIVVTANASGNDNGAGVVVQPDGKIVVGGLRDVSFSEDFAVLRYNDDGTLDSGFSGDGIATAALNGSDVGTELALRADGKIVLVGYTFASTFDFGLARFNADGTLDTSFSGDGLVTTPISNGHDFPWGVAIQTNGAIVVAGYASVGGPDGFAVARYLGPPPCEAGTYRPNLGSDCLSADAGFFVPDPGANSQTPCAAGTFQPNSGATSCTPAAVDFYVPTAGASAQLPCPDGTTTAGLTGQIACVEDEMPNTGSARVTWVWLAAAMLLAGAALASVPRRRTNRPS